MFSRPVILICSDCADVTGFTQVSDLQETSATTKATIKATIKAYGASCKTQIRFVGQMTNLTIKKVVIYWNN